MRAASSPDGINWTNNSLPQNSTWIGLAYGNNHFVAVSSTNGTLTANLLMPGPPAIVLTSPSAGQTWNAGSGITLSATPSVSGATVAQVAYYNGSTLIASVTQSPYSYTWNTATPGSYSISAVVTDSVGHTASSDTVNISVSNGMGISITSPANNAQLTGKSLTLSASVNSNGSTIAQVAYYNGSALMATTNQAPYTIVLPDAESGVYVLTAQVTNADGQVVASAPVNVTLTEEGAGGGGSTGSGGEVLYDIHTDQLNTPRMITDQGGNVVWQWDNQDPYGDNIPNQDPNGTGNQLIFNPRFAGQYFDIETGTHYNYYRDFDPSIGRYLQSDRIGLWGGVNTYAYVGNNPTTYFDRFGLTRQNVNLGNGYTGGVDTYTSNGNAGVEVHVYDPQGNEVGLYGPDGWFNKHGKKGRPEGIPESVENQCRGKIVDFARRAGYIPERGELNIKGRSMGEFMPGAGNVLGVLSIIDLWFQYNEAMNPPCSITDSNDPRWAECINHL